MRNYPPTWLVFLFASAIAASCNAKLAPDPALAKFDISERDGAWKVTPVYGIVITSVDVEELVQHEAIIRELSLSGTQVDDSCLASIARLSGLQRLDLSRTRITSKQLQFLTSCRKLRDLDVSRTHVDNQCLRVLPRLGLATVNLFETDLDYETVNAAVNSLGKTTLINWSPALPSPANERRTELEPKIAFTLALSPRSRSISGFRLSKPAQFEYQVRINYFVKCTAEQIEKVGSIPHLHSAHVDSDGDWWTPTLLVQLASIKSLKEVEFHTKVDHQTLKTIADLPHLDKVKYARPNQLDSEKRAIRAISPKIQLN